LEIATMSESARERAEQSVARSFSRVMNATTSPYGTLTDPPVVAFFSSLALIALLAAKRLDASATVVGALTILLGIPLGIAILASLALSGSRRRVVDWLATIPFSVENLNVVLNGMGEAIEVTFTGEVPKAAELNAALDAISPDCFVTRGAGVSEATPEEGESGTKASDDRVVELRIGVVDSKRNPAATNYQRYERVRALVGQVLVPLHERCPIASARVK